LRDSTDSDCDSQNRKEAANEVPDEERKAILALQEFLKALNIPIGTSLTLQSNYMYLKG
jgi:hypothetical protein